MPSPLPACDSPATRAPQTAARVNLAPSRAAGPTRQTDSARSCFDAQVPTSPPDRAVHFVPPLAAKPFDLEFARNPAASRLDVHSAGIVGRQAERDAAGARFDF